MGSVDRYTVFQSSVEQHLADASVGYQLRVDQQPTNILVNYRSTTYGPQGSKNPRPVVWDK